MFIHYSHMNFLSSFFFLLFLSFGFCTFLMLTSNGVASSLVTLTWLQDQSTKPLDKHNVCLLQHINNIGCAVGCTSRIDSPHHSQSIPLPCRNSVNIDLPCMQQCGWDLTSMCYFGLNIIHQIGLWQPGVGLNKYGLALVAAAPTSHFEWHEQ